MRRWEGLPVITSQPASLTAPVGAAATFSVVASGSPTYQWRFNGANIASATASSYTLSNVQLSNAGNYDVVVSNSAGPVTSSVAVLTVISSGVLANGSFELGFTGWTTNGGNVIWLTYVPRVTDGTNAVEFNAGQTTPNGVLAQSFVTTPGQTYQLAFDEGAIGGTPSTPQSLQVTVSGSGTLLSQTVTVYGTGSSSSAYTTTNFTFVANSAITTLSFQDVSSSGLNMDLLLDNVRVSTQVGGLPVITSQPASLTAPVGAAATFSVVASGSPTYQWRFNGANIASATASSYTLGNVQLSNAGNYDVVVSNSAGPVTSSVAVLTVISSGVLANGSFELGFTGWTTNGGNVFWFNYVPRVTDGTNAVEFNAGQVTPNGVLAQSFVTTPGQAYQLAFDEGAIWGTPSTPQSLQVTVSGSGTLLSQTVTVYGTGSTSSAYTTTNFTFVANSAITTLSFQDVSSSGLNMDLLLDNVRVTIQGAAPAVVALGVPPPMRMRELGGASVERVPEGFRIRMAVGGKGTYELQSSQDFRTWSSVGSFEAGSQGFVEFLDTNAPEAVRFYRITSR